ncbi:CLUMA_CG018385, isoform A [Clunio marinus]|uniref:CLUMA_CG018385, isoform A n=1 Tax=Clunio marinus TaxID=568069 RepID=A0A1J1IYE6_9DIPT|nr:CLUMA_CG018385, isoform A [Clunio marinus]
MVKAFPEYLKEFFLFSQLFAFQNVERSDSGEFIVKSKKVMLKPLTEFSLRNENAHEVFTNVQQLKGEETLIKLLRVSGMLIT